MKKPSLGLIVAFVMVFSTPAPGQGADHDLLLGTVHRDSVLAVPKIEVESPKDRAPVTLLQGPLAVEPSKAYTSKRYEFKQGVLCNQPYRWRVVHEMFWGSGSTGARQFADQVKRIPLEDLAFYDKSNAKRDEQYHAKYPEDLNSKGEYRVVHSWGADVVSSVCFQRPLAPGDTIQMPLGEPFHPTAGVFFDVYPGADNKRLQLFILDQDKIRVWNGTGKPGGVYWDVDWGNKKKELESFPSPFKEAFTVFVRDKDYYFVTESGSIYLSRDPGKGERKVETIWDGHGERRLAVAAVITDATNDKVYCFVEPFFTDKQEEERLYFELSAKPVTTKYKLTKIEKPKIEEPLKSVLEYSHVLQDDKKIK